MIQEMIYFDNALKESIKEHNLNWPEIPNYQYRISIVAGPRSGKEIHYFI